MFSDRNEAGRLLADEMARIELKSPVVLALPRGGVPVAAIVAQRLKAPLDLVIVRKIGAPGNPELAVAAIVDGNPPDLVLNREVIEMIGLSDEELSWLADREKPELERRRKAYRGGSKPVSLAGKTAILVDDGAATGTTMKVALRAIRRRSPARVIVALPVAPPDTVEELSRDADLVICLQQPPHFMALGYHYRQFPQLEDEEVQRLMREAAERRGQAEAPARPGRTP